MRASKSEIKIMISVFVFAVLMISWALYYSGWRISLHYPISIYKVEVVGWQQIENNLRNFRK